MSGTFEIKKSPDGETFFHLKAANGEIILASERYKAKQSALDGIQSVKKNAHLTERYQKLTSTNRKFYFTLSAANGLVIGSSEMYESASARDNGIASVMKNAPSADTIDIAAAS